MFNCDNLRDGVDGCGNPSDVVQLLRRHAFFLKQVEMRLHAQMAFAHDRRGQRIHFKAPLIDPAVVCIGIHPKLGGLAFKVRIVRHFYIRIPRIGHAHQCGCAERSLNLFG